MFFVKYCVYDTSQKCILLHPSLTVPFDYFMERLIYYETNQGFFYPTYLEIILNPKIVMTPISRDVPHFFF